MRRFQTLSPDDQAWAVFSVIFLSYQDVITGAITSGQQEAQALSYGANLEMMASDLDTVFPTSGPPQPPCK